jgi:tetratricopeptide (TPR) repeat protein
MEMSASAIAVRDSQSLLLELKSCSDAALRQELLAAHKTRLSLQSIIDLANEARELLRVDARVSLARSELAIEIASALDDQLCMAHAIRSKANALHFLGQYASAVELHGQVIQLFEAIGQTEELGRSLSASILSLNLCGQYDAAFTAADRAREIFSALGDQLRLARLDINVGNVYYRQDRFAEALECYRRAYDGVIRHGNSEGIAAVLSNLSMCLISLGEFQ